MKKLSIYDKLATKITEKFQELPQVQAIAMAGSQTTGNIDEISDIDLYVYITEDIPVEIRYDIINKIGASRADINNQFWDTGDEWFDKETGIAIDIMYWQPDWIEEQINRVLDRYEAGVGYSTSHWHTIRNSKILYDKTGWFKKLKEKSEQPYPELLRKNVIEKNFALLRNAIPAYINQIEKAIKRKDLITVNHRIAAYLASYFDVIFALNYLPNPGEKRMMHNVTRMCRIIPDKMESQVNELIWFSAQVNSGILEILHLITDNLEDVLLKEGFSLR